MNVLDEFVRLMERIVGNDKPTMEEMRMVSNQLMIHLDSEENTVPDEVWLSIPHETRRHMIASTMNMLIEYVKERA